MLILLAMSYIIITTSSISRHTDNLTKSDIFQTLTFTTLLFMHVALSSNFLIERQVMMQVWFRLFTSTAGGCGWLVPPFQLTTRSLISLSHGGKNIYHPPPNFRQRENMIVPQHLQHSSWRCGHEIAINALGRFHASSRSVRSHPNGYLDLLAHSRRAWAVSREIRLGDDSGLIVLQAKCALDHLVYIET